MIRRASIGVVVAVLGAAVPVAAQTRLTLPEAIAHARAQNPDAGSAAAGEREAAQRITQARAGYLPGVDVAESWQRGNQPVFVFGSLLLSRMAVPVLYYMAKRRERVERITVTAPMLEVAP